MRRPTTKLSVANLAPKERRMAAKLRTSLKSLGDSRVSVHLHLRGGEPLMEIEARWHDTVPARIRPVLHQMFLLGIHAGLRHDLIKRYGGDPCARPFDLDEELIAEMSSEETH